MLRRRLIGTRAWGIRPLQCILATRWSATGCCQACGADENTGPITVMASTAAIPGCYHWVPTHSIWRRSTGASVAFTLPASSGLLWQRSEHSTISSPTSSSSSAVHTGNRNAPIRPSTSSSVEKSGVARSSSTAKPVEQRVMRVTKVRRTIRRKRQPLTESHNEVPAVKLVARPRPTASMAAHVGQTVSTVTRHADESHQESSFFYASPQPPLREVQYPNAPHDRHPALDEEPDDDLQDETDAEELRLADEVDEEDPAGASDAKMEERLGTDVQFELGVEAVYPPSVAAAQAASAARQQQQQSRAPTPPLHHLHPGSRLSNPHTTTTRPASATAASMTATPPVVDAAADDLAELEGSRQEEPEDPMVLGMIEEEILEFCEEVGQPTAVAGGSETAAPAAAARPSPAGAPLAPSALGSLTPGMGTGPSATTAPPPPTPMLDFESPLNLRLATLTRQAGKAFRAIAVHFPLRRGGSMDFELTFEDIASSARLVCKLSEIKTLYFDWIAQFRSTFIALFVPTLHHPSAVLLQHAILNGRPPRPLPPAGSHHPRLNDDADHLLFSFQKLEEMVVSKHEKVREALRASEKKTSTATTSTNSTTGDNALMMSTPLLTVTIMNTTPEEWQSFVASPLSCVPQDFLLSAFNFRPAAQTSISSTLNKELLLAQLSASARTFLFYSSGRSPTRPMPMSTPSRVASASAEDFTSLSTAIAAAAPGRPGASSPASWKLVFVSAPGKALVVPPPMQDLLTGQFVEPLTLTGQHVLYIVGTGNACLAFHQLPTARKGKHAISILLQDIESQLGLNRPHRMNLTAVLTQALESFSRLTWMGLMKLECGQLRAPHPPDAFYRLQRRTVPREIVPSFLEEVFGGGRGAPRPGATAGHPASGGNHHHHSMLSAHQQHMQPLPSDVERYVSSIYNHPERLAREQALRDDLLSCRAFFVHLNSASITAARRSDNPFSNRNGILEAWVQQWTSLTSGASPPITKHMRPNPTRTAGSSNRTPAFLVADEVLPADFPTKPSTDPNPALHANKAVLIAWDVKRTLLFLRTSHRLREFLFNGGRIWCAQYAQYLLRGFDHHNLTTMERTWAMCNDPSKPTPAQPLSPVGKLKVIMDMQLQLAVHARQLVSITKRMDGLLATAEMEGNGLRVVPQKDVSRFANQLSLQREELEKVLQTKIMDFTKEMDDNVRNRINFRSPQDISTIIYGGGLCRYLGSRFVPVRPSKYPITSLFPHFVCHVTGTTVPTVYTQPETLLGSFSSVQKTTVNAFPFTKRQVDEALQSIQLCSRTHLPRGRSDVMQTLLANTAIVVLLCKASMGGMLERVSLYCPTVAGAADAAGAEEGSAEPKLSAAGVPELRVRVVVDEIVPTSTPPGKDPLMTVTQLKRKIREHAPLQQLRRSLENPSTGRQVKAIRNLLILTDCTHERLEVLVDTGVVQTIQEVLFGPQAVVTTTVANGRRDDAHVGSPAQGSSLFAPPMERVCFADLNKAMPPLQNSGDSFEADFSDLNARPPSSSVSAKECWDLLARDHCLSVGMEGLLQSLVSHCASLVGSPRDPFRNSHPLPSVLPQGVHGQERASTDGMLWMATPPNLHPILQRFLQGRVASSSADAIERVTVFLSPYKKGIDLSFFKALQQLRFTEKKLQLFEEGCLFRAVLPECHDRVHGEFCHCVTATGRLSSQSPNLQNIPREEDLRRLFVSRFGTQDGRMVEADYSQLEVVVLATLSGDRRMTEEIKRKVDFHCLRVSLMLKEPYESVEHKVKKLKDPHYIQLRQQAKVFSFQRQYGAGAATIATTTGLTEAEVDTLIAAEESHYNGLNTYYHLVENTVDAGSERLLRVRQLEQALPVHLRRVVLLTTPKNYFVVPTGSRFDLRKDRKSGPRLKNYPVQGLAGEIVQIMCGELVRHFYKKRNYNHRAFLVNTVHDCVWVDCHKSVAELVKRDIAAIMRDTQQRLTTIWPDISFDVPFNAAIQHGPSLGELTSD